MRRQFLTDAETAGLKPRPRYEVEACLHEKSLALGHTTEKLVEQWIKDELEIREKGGLLR